MMTAKLRGDGNKLECNVTLLYMIAKQKKMEEKRIETKIKKSQNIFNALIQNKKAMLF